MECWGLKANEQTGPSQGDLDIRGLLQQCCTVSPRLPLHTRSSARPGAPGLCCPLDRCEAFL